MLSIYGCRPFGTGPYGPAALGVDQFLYPFYLAMAPFAAREGVVPFLAPILRAAGDGVGLDGIWSSREYHPFGDEDGIRGELSSRLRVL